MRLAIMPARRISGRRRPLAALFVLATTGFAGTPLPYHGACEELPLTAIAPHGWLRQYSANQRHGLTGHLEAAGYPFHTIGWAGPRIPDNTSIEDWWPYEQNAYWVDGMIRCGRLLRDNFLIAKARRSIDYVVTHPAPNGYLGPILTPTSAEMNHWNHVVFFRALMAEYAAPGDRRRPEAVRLHYYADPLAYADSRNSLNLEAMLWAWHATGDEETARDPRSRPSAGAAPPRAAVRSPHRLGTAPRRVSRRPERIRRAVPWSGLGAGVGRPRGRLRPAGNVARASGSGLVPGRRSAP